MAFAHIQGVGANGVGASLSVTVTATALNDLLAVNYFALAAVTGVTDNQSNSYADALTPVSVTSGGTTGTSGQQFAVQAHSGTTSVTVTMGSSTNLFVTVDEFSGNATTSVLGSSSSGSDAVGSTAVSVAAFSPTAGSLVVAGIGSFAAETGTAGSGYAVGANVSGLLESEYRLSATASETAPFTLGGSSAWIEVAAEYKAAPTFDATSMGPALTLAVQIPELTGFAVVGY